MVSEYTSFHPPGRAGMKMVEGPWFFERFGGGWVFTAVNDTTTDTTWRYTFTIRPKFLAPIADRIGVWFLRRDIERRIAAFARGCADPGVLEVANELANAWGRDET